MKTLPDNEKKGITVKIDASLHAEVRQYLESHGMTMTEFVTQALQDELHPKINMKEGNSMGNMRTLAFQVPEEMFQRIKEYLQRNNMTQKEFMLGLIETELNRDLQQRSETSFAEDQQNEPSENHSEDIHEEAEENMNEPDNTTVSDSSESDDSEDMDEDESEYMGMSM